jgi:hypothetical protein
LGNKGITFYSSEKYIYEGIFSNPKVNVLQTELLNTKCPVEAKDMADQIAKDNGSRVLKVKKHYIWSTSYYGQIMPDGRVMLHQYDHNAEQLRSEVLNKDLALLLNEGVRSAGVQLSSRKRKQRIVEKLVELFKKYDKYTLDAIDDNAFIRSIYQMEIERFKSKRV